MSDGGKIILDESQRGTICAIVALGGSRARAAKAAGCKVRQIEALARSDVEFARQLARAESKPELEHLKHIQAAAADARYWRAAAWALEHLYPEDYALRRPQSMSAEQIRLALTEFADIILVDITDESLRDKILERLDKLADELADQQTAQGRGGPDQAKSSDDQWGGDESGGDESDES
jgi:hypothetical protein